MRSAHLLVPVTLFGLVLALACGGLPGSLDEEINPPEGPCGLDTVPLMAGQHYDAGTITVSNDDENLVVVYQTSGDWVMTETHLHVGCSLFDFPTNRGGNPQVGHFDYNDSWDPALTSVTYTIPLADIECFDTCGQDLAIAAHASVERDDGTGGTQQETAWGAGTEFPGASWATWFTYTVECCTDDTGEPPDEPCTDPGDYRTQTQGGWGTGAAGDNPGVYRDANFEACIGDLVLGADYGYGLTLTSPAAVEDFLPQGGTPGSLDQDLVDPLETSAGVLAGQVTALALSVAFDACDPDFGAAPGALADTVAQWGDCEGATVAQILAAGECVLAGSEDCGVDADTINTCLTDANEAFVDGTEVSGYLCP